MCLFLMLRYPQQGWVSFRSTYILTDISPILIRSKYLSLGSLMSMSLPSYEKREGRDGKKEKVSFSSLSPITSFPSQKTKKAGRWNREAERGGGSFTLKASKGVSHQEHFPSRPFSRPKNLKIRSVFSPVCRQRHLSKIAKRGFQSQEFLSSSPPSEPLLLHAKSPSPDRGGCWNACLWKSSGPTVYVYPIDWWVTTLSKIRDDPTISSFPPVAASKMVLWSRDSENSETVQACQKNTAGLVASISLWGNRSILDKSNKSLLWLLTGFGGGHGRGGDRELPPNNKRDL